MLQWVRKQLGEAEESLKSEEADRAALIEEKTSIELELRSKEEEVLAEREALERALKEDFELELEEVRSGRDAVTKELEENRTQMAREKDRNRELATGLEREKNELKVKVAQQEGELRVVLGELQKQKGEVKRQVEALLRNLD